MMIDKTCVLCGRLLVQPRLSHWLRLHHSWTGYQVRQTSSAVLLDCKYNSLKAASGRRYLTQQKWQEPSGFDTGIQIYNSTVKKKVPLILQQDKILKWYSCGPTVYDNCHLGHASSYVRQDIIKRILAAYFGIDTINVMGVTDVDDKIIHRAQETGKSISQITKHYENDFFFEMERLNILPPNMVVRVSEHIDCIIKFIEGIEKKGLAYKAKDGSVYFDVETYGRYGLFQELSQKHEDHHIKKSGADFALWKAQKPGEPFWQSPWGPGRPGWHIECSAMASEVFGSNFDLHSGGEDLAFPHHENEVAQSCAFHDCEQWVNYWLHTGHLHLIGDSNKMSKSLKNVVPVSQLLEEFTANHFRMLCLLSHYKKKLGFDSSRMNKAVAVTKTFDNFVLGCDNYVNGNKPARQIPEAQLFEKLIFTKEEVRRAFADDFNTPRALAHLMRLVNFVNDYIGDDVDTGSVVQSRQSRSPASVAAVGMYVKNFLSQVGMVSQQSKQSHSALNEEHLTNTIIETTLNTRNKIREFAKNKKFLIEKADEVGLAPKAAKKLQKTLYQPLWGLSDDVRLELQNKANIVVEDLADGCSRWQFAESKVQKVHKDKLSSEISEKVES